MIEVLSKKKISFLKPNEVDGHFLKTEKELLNTIYENKENIIVIREKSQKESKKHYK